MAAVRAAEVTWARGGWVPMAVVTAAFLAERLGRQVLLTGVRASAEKQRVQQLQD